MLKLDPEERPTIEAIITNFKFLKLDEEDAARIQVVDNAAIDLQEKFSKLKLSFEFEGARKVEEPAKKKVRYDEDEYI